MFENILEQATQNDILICKKRTPAVIISSDIAFAQGVRYLKSFRLAKRMSRRPFRLLFNWLYF